MTKPSKETKLEFDPRKFLPAVPPVYLTSLVVSFFQLDNIEQERTARFSIDHFSNNDVGDESIK